MFIFTLYFSFWKYLFQKSAAVYLVQCGIKVEADCM